MLGEAAGWTRVARGGAAASADAGGRKQPFGFARARTDWLPGDSDLL